MTDILISIPEKEVTIFAKESNESRIHRYRMMIFGSMKVGAAKSITEIYELDASTNTYDVRYETENYAFANEEDCLLAETKAAQQYRRRYQKQADYYYDHYGNEAVDINHSNGTTNRIRLDAEKTAKIEDVLEELNIKDRQVMLEIRSILFGEAMPKVYEEMWGSW